MTGDPARARVMLRAAGILAGVCLAMLCWSACPADATTRSASVGPSVTGSSAPLTFRLAPARAANAAASKTPTDAKPPMLDLDGIRHEMQKARGHALFVHLWASWCGPCLEELPLVDRFAREARARGATVLSVSLDNDWRGIARVPAVLRARAPSLTTFVAQFDDPDQFMSLFSRAWEGAIPALFAFDGAGKLSTSLIGEVEPAQLDALLTHLAPRPSQRTSPGPGTTPQPGRASRPVGAP